jgi:deoxyribonuclease-4
MGLEPFRRLLNDRRFAHCAFIAETPVEEPEDDRRNVETMKSLVIRAQSAELRKSSRL